eukprot:TRINITY_DN27162_c0_g1_i1.p1 TRINITY_DN27162_c0_g1~~TRINITY_DN27162_c0_g1_i1.p1  ORF type:complete len:372 (+),score=47.59 TRINITY_DN27162_c0_g1_i1:54-1169(+)
MFKLANDPGLSIDVLSCVDLLDWSRFGAISGWACTSVRNAKRQLRRSVRQMREGFSARDLCLAMDLTGLWAVLTEDEGDSKGNTIDVAVQGRVDLFEMASDNSLLHCALKAFGEEADLMVSWLLSLNAAEEAVIATNWSRQTALHLCARNGQTKSALRILQFPRVLVDAVDMYEATPLINAVRHEHPEMVDVLLAARANPNAFVPNCHGHGQTPLTLAVRLKNTEIVSQLVRDPRIDLHKSTLDFVPFGKTAIDFAPSVGPLRNILEAAIDAERRRGQKPVELPSDEYKLPGGAFARQCSQLSSVSTTASTTSRTPPSLANSLSPCGTSFEDSPVFHVQSCEPVGIAKTETTCCATVVTALWRNLIKRITH